MADICAIFSLDENTKYIIQSYRDILSVNYGVPKKELYPHITISYYLSIEEEDIIKYSKEVLEDIGSFEIEYDSIKMLGENCVALVANQSGMINDFYNKYHQKFDEYCNIWTKKTDNLWIPHSTISGDYNGKLKEMKNYLDQHFVPFKGQIIKFELSKIKETGFEIIYSKELTVVAK